MADQKEFYDHVKNLSAHLCKKYDLTISSKPDRFFLENKTV